MKKVLYQFFFVLLLLVTNSCNLDNFDLGKLSDEINLSPEFVAPVANASFSVWDVIESVNNEDDTLLKVGDDDIIRIIYTEEGIYDYKVSELLDLPTDKSFSTGNKEIGEISLSSVAISRQVSLRQITDEVDGDIDQIVPFDGQTQTFPASSYTGPTAQFTVNSTDEFTSITLSDGDLEIQLENQLKWVPMTLEGDFYDNQTGQVVASFSFVNLTAGQVDTKTVALDGKTISNDIVFRMTKFETGSSATPVLIDLDDYFALNLTFNNLKISSGNVKIPSQEITGFSGSFNFEFEDEVKVFESAFKYGTVDIASVNNSQIDGTITVTFPDIAKGDGNALSLIIPFGSNASETLANAIIDFTADNAMPYNKIPYEYSISVQASTGFVNFNSTDGVSLDVSLASLEFQSLKGDFGDRAIQITDGNFNMDMEFLDKITGDFKLANPIINLIITNSIGVPATINADFIASDKEGTQVALNPESFDLATPANLNSGAVVQTITIDKDNSNIVNFIALPPSGAIQYSGDIVFNPDGAVTTANPNFFDMDGSLKIDLGVDLPFEFQVEQLTFEDTTGITGDDFDMLSSGELTVNAVNGIPMNIDLEIAFVDTLSGQQIGSKISSSLLDAASVSGGVVTPASSTNSITLTESDMDNLRNANGITFKGILASPGDGTEAAAIKAESTLEISVVIKAKLDL